AVSGEGVTASAAFTGRCNLIAERRGVLVLDRERLDRLNLIDEAVTIATLPPYDIVEPKQMAATVKIIPFAVAGSVMEACLAVATADEESPLIRVAELRPRRVGLVQTTLPGLKESILDKTRRAMDARLAALDCPPAEEVRCGHTTDEVAAAVGRLRANDCAIVLVSGASAIVDRRDIVPAGIEQAGGKIDHFGMPVDPGNLILLAHDDAGPILGLPGCARSPKLNGFDWVLARLMADVHVAPRDVMVMGAGGLLTEIPVRPLPRAAAVEAETSGGKLRAPRIAALVLAAGRSTRMGRVNKLLADVEGRPMVAKVAETALTSQAEHVVVVTGHDHDKVESALAGRDLTTIHNPDYAAGLSTSLHRGLAALPDDCDGVVICLGDMPRITAAVIDKLIAAFNPIEGRAICVPTWQGKRGNPVLLARRFLPEIQAISGDIGAKSLISAYPEAVAEVPMGDDSVLFDVDTPDVLATLKSAG
ncbi:MAG: molybdopterin-binding/glycosyltransferase family 2 protein, partial [Kiloniellales bacterium]|nr:molybdopterin-binding/glycosyltransferase family 2 protein [Kiloniellales bacterium]